MKKKKTKQIPSEAVFSGNSDVGQTQEELSYFFDKSLSLLCIAGFDGYFKRLNLAWESTLGWTLDDLKSQSFIEFVHPHDKDATLSELEGLIQGGRTIEFENRYRCKDGTHKWLQWDATSLPNREQVFAIARDVTVRRGLEKEILNTSDREKERLGRELHDGLCQNLAGIAAMSTALSRKLAAKDETLAEEVGEIASLLNELIGNARDMARGLNPISLSRKGICGALEELAANVEALFQVSCRIRCHPAFPQIKPEFEAHLFRIAQEAINNAITHARGKKIEISIGFQGAEGLLSISDNGVGFLEKELDNNTLGLHSMEYRARILGGALRVRPGSPRGTKVSCVFPLSPNLLKD